MQTRKLIAIVVLLTVLVLISSSAVAAWQDCTPPGCPDGSSGSVSCSGTVCTRTCQIQKCSSTYTLDYELEDSSRLPEWDSQYYEDDDSGRGYEPDSESYCYKFEYQGSKETESDKSECYDLYTSDGGEWDSSHDCNGNKIKAYAAIGFESDEGSRSWLKTVKNKDNDAYGWTGNTDNSKWEYFWISHLDDDSKGRYYRSNVEWDGLEHGLCNEAGVARVYCTPSNAICSNSGLSNCGYGCLYDNTRPRAAMGIYRNIRDRIKDAFEDEWDCSSKIKDNYLDYDDAWYKVYRAPLTTTSQTKTCNRINQKPYMNWVYLNPKNPDINTNLQCSYSATDPEGQSITVEYNWYQNGTAKGINLKDLSSVYTRKGDKWKCAARVKDTFGLWSDWKYSGELTIAGVKPKFTQNTYIDGDGATAQSPLTVGNSVTLKAKTTDLDGDSTKLRICHKNGCNEQVFCESSSSTAEDKYCSFAVTVSASTLGFTSFVTDGDSTITGVTGTIHVNHKPIASAPKIMTRSEFHINSRITCNLHTYSDPDGDTIHEAAYRWYKNNNLLSPDTKWLDCDSVGCNVDDTIKCAWQPADQHGLKGDWTGTSNSVRIRNTKPYFTAVPTSDSNLANPTAEGAHVTFTANLGDLEGNPMRIFVCDEQGMKDSSGCSGTEYCRTTYTTPGKFECKYNTAGISESQIKWTLMVCDDWHGCLQHPNINTFFVDLQRPADVRVYLNLELYKELLGLLDKPKTISGFEGKLNTFLDDCSADEKGYCYYPVTISSESQGRIKLYDVNIDYSITNEIPMFNPINDIYIVEGEIAQVHPYAYDPDDYPLTYTYGTPLNSQGMWQTKPGDIGEYTASVKASDGVHTITESVQIIVADDGLCLTPCSDYCEGSSSFTDGWCNFGICTYDTVLENSTSCGYNPCDYKTCNGYCTGFDYSSPSCSVIADEAVCSYEIIPDSLECCTPECNSYTDCDDGIPSTKDYCINPGTCNAECTTEDCSPACTSDAECGNNMKCKYPGQCNSLCVSSLCEIACDVDSQCDDNNPSTFDKCNLASSCNAYCSNSACETRCSSNLDCDDHNPVTTDVCRNKETCDSYCENTADALPDLEVSSPKYLQQIEHKGTMYDMYEIHITNKGSIEAEFAWTKNINNSPKQGRISLNPDQSVTFHETVPVGQDTTITLSADTSNEVHESNENNNIYSGGLR